MRKTSHDGIDATSITSSIENEIKKAGTNINKIKKSSIKRKVQNFSHESDDGIIEPLLQIDKEKSEIANSSAKYLLNKSKTDSYERGNDSSDNFTEKNSISTVVCSTSKIVNNTEKENQISPSYKHGTAPMHNHMNTNIFGTYDISKGVITTKSPILVEIDGCKSSVYTPNPLIFTTAKIHTDGKTKIMEPVHVTPVPILSTIEASVVRTVANNFNENNLSNAPTKSINLMTNVCSKSDANDLQTIKGQTLVSTTENTIFSNTEPLTTYLNESQSKDKKEPHIINAIKECGDNPTTSQNLNNIIKNSILPITTTSSMQTKISKTELCTENITSLKSNDSLQTNTKPVIGTSKVALNSTTISQKNISTDRRKESNIGEHKDFSVKVQLPLNLQKADDISKKLKSPKTAQDDMKYNVTLENKISPVYPDQNQVSKSKIVKSIKLDSSDEKDTANKGKILATGSKKLHRQKNAALEEVGDTATASSVSIEKSNKTQDISKKSIKNNEKIVLNKEDCQSTIPTTLTLTATTNVSKPTVLVPVSTSKIKTTETTHLTSISKIGMENVSKPLSKTSIVTSASTPKETFKIIPSITSIKSQSSAKTSAEKAPIVTTSNKPDIALSSSQLSQTSKLECPVKSESPELPTTLPAYIVSTSKTKIGSTLTSNTITNISKIQIQKPKNEVVYTPTETFKVTLPAQQSDRPTVGSSSSNGTKQSNFSHETKQKSEKNKKDGRA